MVSKRQIERRRNYRKKKRDLKRLTKLTERLCLTENGRLSIHIEKNTLTKTMTAANQDDDTDEEATAAGRQQTPAAGRQEAPAAGRHETPMAGRHETPTANKDDSTLKPSVTDLRQLNNTKRLYVVLATGQQFWM